MKMRSQLVGALILGMSFKVFSSFEVKTIEASDGFEYSSYSDLGYVAENHTTKGFSIYNDEGETLISSPSNYRVIDMRQDNLLIAENLTDFYFCKVKNIANQDFSTLLNECDNISEEYAAEGYSIIHQLLASNSVMNDEGVLAIPVSETEVVFRNKNNDLFLIENTLPFYGMLSSGKNPYYSNMTSIYKLENSGPVAISQLILSSQAEIAEHYRIVGHVDNGKILLATMLSNVDKPAGGSWGQVLYECRISSEKSFPDTVSLNRQQTADLVKYFYKEEPEWVYVAEMYPEIPADVSTFNDLADAGDLPPETTQQEFESIIFEKLDELTVDYTSYLNPVNPLPCEANTIEYVGIKDLPFDNYFQPVSASGSYITIENSTDHLDHGTSTLGVPLWTVNQTEVDISALIVSEIIGTMSNNEVLDLIEQMNSGDKKFFNNYPDYPSNLKDAGFSMLATESDVDRHRNAQLLKELGFKLNKAGGSWYILNTADDALLVKNQSYTEKSWIITQSEGGENDLVQVVVTPSNPIIDPYANPTSQFSIDLSGSDIYGLDVSCNVSSASLAITAADYNGVFGSQNSMTLPLVFDATSVTGTETLVAPELPFEGEGSFVLADVVAEFTTEDVDVVCAAEVSDQDGNLLQVGLTPATIRIDDGVHGGNASVSGTIVIPGVDDLSGVEVVLTIDGRQVTVTTDENGNFTFDGLRDGEFTVSLATENYVQSCQEATVADGNSVDLGSIEMLAGDINADGAIDIADFTYMAARYRAQQGDADYDAKADLNSDGIINIQDLAILASHFGSTQCNPVQ